MQIDDPPTRTGFITALDDAYLMPREEGYAVFWRTSGHDLCTVQADVAERALRRQGKVVRLGTWSGTLHGRARTTGRCGGRAACHGRRRATSRAASRSCC
jgi:hypothetical protein